MVKIQEKAIFDLKYYKTFSNDTKILNIYLLNKK